jgi:acyl-coenzyme A synthetase/AMP-(fatty) acid ligase
MHAEPGAAWPLLTRLPDAVVCRRGGLPVPCAQFLGEAAALAAGLPERRFALNLCADRTRMLLGFAAALWRGQTTLLCADRSAHRLRALAARYPDAYVIADQPIEAPLPVLRLGAVPPASGAIPAMPAIPAGLVAAIAFTSGSTGEPAAHAKPWGALAAAAAGAAERFRLRPGDGDAASIIATVPPQHMYGFETTIMLPLQAAVAVDDGDTFYPSDLFAALAAAAGRRILVTTPLQLRALLAAGPPPVPLEAVISATAPLAASLAAAVEQAWRVPVLEIYGATEAGSIASRRTTADPAWLPYAGVELRPDGVVMPGLGLVPLADALEPVPGGRFRLLGRRSDVVKLGGRRASLADLNRLLAEVAGVEDGVFVAPEDLEANPAGRLTAYVVAPGRTAEDILAALRDRLEAIFLPRPVVMLAALPRDALGKLSRRALAELRRASAGGA